MTTLEWYEEWIQRYFEPICEKLPKLRTLLCNSTREKIGENDSVYYDRKGVVSGEARNPVESLYLGTLSEVQDWCRKKCGSTLSAVEIEVEQESIGPFLSDDIFRRVIESKSGSMCSCPILILVLGILAMSIIVVLELSPFR